MQLSNSFSKQTETFVPIEEGKVIMYVCGLTPYDHTHIGHSRTYVAFDTLKRYLLKKGLSFYHIQNITDVDDKIIKRCKETGSDPKTLTSQIHDEAVELFSQLNILKADVYPKVTENIPEIIGLINQLIATGHAYETDTGVYFNVKAFKNYGLLSGQQLDEIEAGSRIDVDESKKMPEDFALWKKTNGEIIEFDSPWGTGRPGWHIECSAMAAKYGKRPDSGLKTLDIHGGARDLIFPHHENEIAQSEGAFNQKFCNYWLHTGFLTVDGEKMSKSLGNFITIKDALSKNSPNALRLFYLKAHYRSPLDYSSDSIDSLEESVERIFNSLGLLKEAVVNAKASAKNNDKEFRQKSDELIKYFYSSMENDLNTPEAIASLFNLLRLANSHCESKSIDCEELVKIVSAIEEMLWILGLKENKKSSIEDKFDPLCSLLLEIGIDKKPKNAEAALELFIAKREEARKSKDYKTSDAIRSGLAKLGIVLEDTKSGIRWKI
ncbi:cysteine--tRNA ligase [Candidatus Micrarchaeota archaeon]|nr:cysteine--tRNA ligase [Candidatus Micrarchaeota archaeon]